MVTVQIDQAVPPDTEPFALLQLEEAVVRLGDVKCSNILRTLHFLFAHAPRLARMVLHLPNGLSAAEQADVCDLLCGYAVQGSTDFRVWLTAPHSSGLQRLVHHARCGWLTLELMIQPVIRDFSAF